MNGKKFIGVLLYAGHTTNGNGKWIRLILTENGNRCDAILGRDDSDSFREVEKLYPGISFPVQLDITNHQYKEYFPMMNYREEEYRKSGKRLQGSWTAEEYHKFNGTFGG